MVIERKIVYNVSVYLYNLLTDMLVYKDLISKAAMNLFFQEKKERGQEKREIEI